MDHRIEKDSMGRVKVASDKLWGAQTQRSLENFDIGIELMPKELVKGYAFLKKACALSNLSFAKLPQKKCDLIVRVCEEIIQGELDEHFPLHVWQTGSGTHTNMNLNEVIANRAYELDSSLKLNPNDDVNMSQSSNDTFPSAMKIALLMQANVLKNSLDILIESFEKKEEEFKGILKVGRTHLQDATNLYLSDEISGYTAMLKSSKEQILDTLKYIKQLPIGGTAVGTGLNAPEDFDKRVCSYLNQELGLGFVPLENKFYGLTSHDGEVFLSGALSSLASNLMKIANDIRWLGSGPNCAIGELVLPKNEPGSSIMPSKMNPSQCEALTMIAVQVMGNHSAVSFAAGQGNFELNVFRPLIINNLLQSIRLLSDGMDSFSLRCINGIKADREKIKSYLAYSLTELTLLAPYVGYGKSAKIARYAAENCLSIKEAALRLNILTEEEFDAYMNVMEK